MTMEDLRVAMTTTHLSSLSTARSRTTLVGTAVNLRRRHTARAAATNRRPARATETAATRSLQAQATRATLTPARADTSLPLRATGATHTRAQNILATPVALRVDMGPPHQDMEMTRKEDQATAATQNPVQAATGLLAMAMSLDASVHQSVRRAMVGVTNTATVAPTCLVHSEAMSRTVKIAGETMVEDMAAQAMEETAAAMARGTSKWRDVLVVSQRR